MMCHTIARHLHVAQDARDLAARGLDLGDVGGRDAAQRAAREAAALLQANLQLACRGQRGERHAEARGGAAELVLIIMISSDVM